MREIDLYGMLADDAMKSVHKEILTAKKCSELFFRIIHGYGSTGDGGEIKIRLQKS